MTITAYRIVKQRYAAAIWSGNGARDFGGRWNSKGVAVVYTAQNRALAAMEQLVHLIKPRILSGFVIASVTFGRKQMEQLDPVALPMGWDDPVAPPELQRLGDAWIARGRQPVLAVPSAVIRGELNYLLNPNHPDFAGLPRTAPEPFGYDYRLA